MRVNLVTQKTIEAYTEKNAQSRIPFNGLMITMKRMDWNIPSDIVANFSAADLLGNGSNRVIFDLGGNSYRMICEYLFGRKVIRLYVCWIGTHAEYDKLCKDGKQYTISDY